MEDVFAIWDIVYGSLHYQQNISSAFQMEAHQILDNGYRSYEVRNNYIFFFDFVDFFYSHSHSVLFSFFNCYNILI